MFKIKKYNKKKFQIEHVRGHVLYRKMFFRLKIAFIWSVLNLDYKLMYQCDLTKFDKLEYNIKIRGSRF